MEYAKDVLVSTDWVAQNLNTPGIRLIEVDEDILLYDTGHIPGAVKLDWQTDLWQYCAGSTFCSPNPPRQRCRGH